MNYVKTESSAYYYSNIANDSKLSKIDFELRELAEKNKKLVYFLNKPLLENKNFEDIPYGIILIPDHKLIFVSVSNNNNEFEDFVDDFIEDTGHLSKKFNYINLLDRPKIWRKNLVVEKHIGNLSLLYNIIDNPEFLLVNYQEKRNANLLISLITGSINDIRGVALDEPKDLLENIKKKIVLFDGQQTKFIHHPTNEFMTKIQGLSGTGKTELLLHKLIEFYTEDQESKILFTCHNKILAKKLQDRIPKFFNFMKVEEQIEWNRRLWCMHAWGSRNAPHTGTLSYICNFYNIPFQTFSQVDSFDIACKNAINEISKNQDNINKDKPFDYIIIDESQDFPNSFFELCKLVAGKKIYIAGDIFQSIFDDPKKDEIDADFLLNRCYRTDPRTLMFSHGLGMNLFENGKQLRWLDKKQWHECGYIVQDMENEYILTREPVRRFEDIEDENLGVKIETVTPDNDVDSIIRIIENLKSKYETISPDDIAIIIVPEKHIANNLYDLVKKIESKIHERFNGWGCNIAYETKEIIKDQVFITNTNNIKGLEYPFVIVICNNISNSYLIRNSLYMSLTRSFLESYLVSYDNDLEKINKLQSSLNYINRERKMICPIPSKEHQQEIQMKLINYYQDFNAMEYAYNLSMNFPEKFQGMSFDLMKDQIDNNGKITKEDLDRYFDDLKKVMK